LAGFCPEWIFSICCTQASIEYLSAETLLESCAVKYADGISKNYQTIAPESITSTAEQLLLFLSEIDAGDTAVSLLNTYVFNRLKFEATRKPRKLKGLFGSAFDATKTIEYSPEKCVKLFKATIFGMRSNVNPAAPTDWTIQQETDLEWLGELLNKKTDIFDSLLGD
tara:strand:- start:478 stop:978 length:501 start_codon:yes stop_codon:yes gene_type:complete